MTMTCLQTCTSQPEERRENEQGKNRRIQRKTRDEGGERECLMTAETERYARPC